MATQLFAEDLLTTDQKKHTNIRLLSETADGVKIMHDTGMTIVPKRVLPPSFCKLHEIKAPADAGQPLEDEENRQMLAAFVAARPTFSAKDGRQFKSSQITKVDPTGLRVMSESGFVRLKFEDLPELVREAFAYDPKKSELFEKEQSEKIKKLADAQLKISNAESVVDGFSGTGSVVLVQNVGKVWLCYVQRKTDQEVTYTTSRVGAILDGSPTIYEEHKAYRNLPYGEPFLAMILGIPDYRNLPLDARGRRTMTTKYYQAGRFDYVTQTAGDARKHHEYIPVLHVDRSEALRLVMTYSINQAYTEDGVPDTSNHRGETVECSGTGFAISDDGFIATAEHVVHGALEVSVKILDKEYPASVVKTDEEHDLAIVRVQAVQTKGLHIAKADELSLGADLFVTGFPLVDLLGFSMKMTKGSLTSLSGIRDDKSRVQISVPLQPGNSGGPVCNKKGEVIGVAESVMSTLRATAFAGGVMPQNVNHAVKADYLVEMSKSLSDLKLVDAGAEAEPEKRVMEATFFISVKAKE